jgi:hypothetical protein
MKFKYREVMDMGFSRIDDRDDVFFDYNGYGYFIVYKNITPNIQLDWDSETHKITIFHSDESGHTLEKFVIKSREKLKNFIAATELVSDFGNVKSFFKK